MWKLKIREHKWRPNATQLVSGETKNLRFTLGTRTRSMSEPWFRHLPVVRTWLNYSGFLLPKLEIWYLIYRVVIKISQCTHSEYYPSWNVADVQQIIIPTGEKPYERLLESFRSGWKSGFHLGVSVCSLWRRLGQLLGHLYWRQTGVNIVKTEMKRSPDAKGDPRALCWPQTHLSQKAF